MAHTKKPKRAVGSARKATDKRVVGTSQNPSTMRGDLAGGAGSTHLTMYRERRVRSAGRPKRAS
ncbi:hypothetical protein HWB05_gp046 [Streptomyces phage BRock]|uniref:Uncharacterized protein n=1 Tax=Streptomyces phage BRock TaxID=1913591 RepID=A0A1J0GVV7_9CAUD|nr:hypothetical protein HWB05_gp046 [Streptomyces phage BRock]APC46308.1 hypothetical protein [Streptomyces phage BRock]